MQYLIIPPAHFRSLCPGPVFYHNFPILSPLISGWGLKFMDDICARFQPVKTLSASCLGCPLPDHLSVRLINELQSGASQQVSCFRRRFFHIYDGCIIAHNQTGNLGHSVPDSKFDGSFLQFISLRRFHLNQTVFSCTQILCIMPLPAGCPFFRCLPS